MKKLPIDITPGAYIYAAAALLILPIPWFAAVTSAALLHELGHILALELCKVKITKFTVGLFGARISTVFQTPLEELVCAASGPAAGLLAAWLFGAFPRFAFCCFVHSLFNFLPVYPFDGGRVLRCAVLMLVGDRYGSTPFRLIQVLLLVSLLWILFVWC